MKSPARRHTFLILAAAVLLLMPVAEAAGDILYIVSPHDSNADSPGVAIMQLTHFVIVLAIFSPIFALFVWFVWRRYTGARPLLSFSSARPFLSLALWFVFGALAAFCLVGVFFIRRVPDIPWTAHGVLTAYFLLSCNASLLATYARHARPNQTMQSTAGRSDA